MKITNFIRKEVFDFLDKIFGGEENFEGIYFTDELTEGECPIDYYIYYNITKGMWVSEVNFDFSFDCGVTKIVLFPKDKNYVIKIPCSGLYKMNYENEDKPLPILSANVYDNVIDEEIAFYNDVKNILNINEEEAEIIKSILMQNYYMGDYGNTPIYIQAKADDYAEHSCSDVRSSIINKMVGHDFEDEWVNGLIERYGIQVTDNILEILAEIEDLHSSNYGYYKEMPIIFDYGGYSACMWDWI